SRLDQRVDALRVAWRDRDGDLAERRLGQAMPHDPLPGRAAVARHEDSAAGPAALSSPRLDVDLPRAGEESPRVVRIHREIGNSGVLVHEEDPLPGLPAVHRAVNAALLLRAVTGPDRRR